MNPKDAFLNKLTTIVNDFEASTGVYIKSIDFERFGTRDVQDISSKSVITGIKLNFK